MTETYLNNRALEIMGDPLLRPLAAMACEVPGSEIDFYIIHETTAVRETLKQYLRGAHAG